MKALAHSEEKDQKIWSTVGFEKTKIDTTLSHKNMVYIKEDKNVQKDDGLSKEHSDSNDINTQIRRWLLKICYSISTQAL